MRRSLVILLCCIFLTSICSERVFEHGLFYFDFNNTIRDGSELVQDDLINTSKENLASSDVMSARSDVIFDGNSYVIAPGGYLFGTPYLYNTFKDKATLQFIGKSGGGGAELAILWRIPWCFERIFTEEEQ